MLTSGFLTAPVLSAAAAAAAGSIWLRSPVSPGDSTLPDKELEVFTPPITSSGTCEISPYVSTKGSGGTSQQAPRYRPPDTKTALGKGTDLRSAATPAATHSKTKDETKRFTLHRLISIWLPTGSAIDGGRANPLQKKPACSPLPPAV